MKRVIMSTLAIRSKGLIGVSPRSATLQSRKGAIRLVALTRRMMRDISRIWAGPWRAPVRKFVPRSKGTPTSPTSTPCRLFTRGVRMKVATSAKRGTMLESTGWRGGGLSFMACASMRRTGKALRRP